MSGGSERRGLTSIELIVGLGVLAILVAATMVYWTRVDRGRWEAMAAAEPARVFELTCEPTKAAYTAKENVCFVCELRNTARYPLTFRWGRASFGTDRFRHHRMMEWAFIENPDQTPSHYIETGHAPTLESGEVLLLRMKLGPPLRGPTGLPKFSGPIEFRGEVMLTRSPAGIVSNAVEFVVHPPERAAAPP